MEWIGEIIKTLSTIVTAAVACWGVSTWRRQVVGKRRMEIAEEALLAAYQVRDVIAAARMPVTFKGEGSTRPPFRGEQDFQKEILDSFYAPLERMQKQTDKFASLYLAGQRFRVHFGPQHAEIFGAFHQARMHVMQAAECLIEEHIERSTTSEEIKGWKADLWRSLSPGRPDDLARSVDEAVGKLETICRPVLADAVGPERFLQWIGAVGRRGVVWAGLRPRAD